MKRLHRISALSLVFILLWTSCSKDDKVDPGTAPEIPPVSTMVMDFSNFQNDNGGRTATMLNWAQAALVAGVWNAVIAVNLAVPVAAFNASIHQTPTYDQDNKVWVWKFDYDFAGVTYTAELNGALITDGVDWKMYISRENGFQHFLWYSGQMNTGGTSGYWELNFSPENNVKYLHIDWEKTGDGVGDIKYTNVNSGSDSNGSYIEYGNNADGDFDAFYNLYSAPDNSSIKIEWNTTTKAGHIQINDGPFKCWDENLQDTTCG